MHLRGLYISPPQLFSPVKVDLVELERHIEAIYCVIYLVVRPTCTCKLSLISTIEAHFSKEGSSAIPARFRTFEIGS